MQTSHLLSTFLAYALICLCSAKPGSDASKHPAYTRECVIWQNISRSMEREPNVNINCQRNNECSGMDCIGKYNVSMASLFHIAKDFCSGLVVEACSHPTKVQMYIVMFNSRNNTQETEVTITNSTEIPVKGTQFKVLGNDAHGVLDVKMNHTTIDGQPHIFLKAFLRVKVHAKVFGIAFDRYLDGFEVAIVRGMFIPVPHCDLHVGNHTHLPGRCNWETIGQLKREGPMTSCNTEELDSCSSSEMCEAKRCVCIPGFTYTPQFSCAPEINVDYEEPFSVDDTGQSTKVSHKQVIIIVCSIAGLLVLSVIIAAFVIKYRRYQARYGQHQLVLEEEDDPEVTI